MGMVVGDETRLRQIITNLVRCVVASLSLSLLRLLRRRPYCQFAFLTRTSSNARKFTPARCCSGIQSNGAGMAAGCVSFFHYLLVATTLTRACVCVGGKGTGLGLALVRQIVKLSGGRLGLRSKVGEGSTFWYVSPIRIACRLYVVRQKLTTTCTQGGAPARRWAQGNDAHTRDAANRHPHAAVPRAGAHARARAAQRVARLREHCCGAGRCGSGRGVAGAPAHDTLVVGTAWAHGSGCVVFASA